MPKTTPSVFLDEDRILKRVVAALSSHTPVRVVETDINGKERTTASNKFYTLAFDVVMDESLKMPRDGATKRYSPPNGFAPVTKIKPTSLNYREYPFENMLPYNPPYGIFPQLMTLDPAELTSLANQFAVKKYEYLERGHYWLSFLYTWRQRLIERILNRTATMEVQ